MIYKDRQTRNTKKRYNRIAFLYDLMESLVEHSSHSQWRKLLWGKVEGDNIPEVGMGTGKNFPFYPQDAQMAAIDFSPKMLQRARD